MTDEYLVCSDGRAVAASGSDRDGPRAPFRISCINDDCVEVVADFEQSTPRALGSVRALLRKSDAKTARLRGQSVDIMLSAESADAFLSGALSASAATDTRFWQWELTPRSSDWLPPEMSGLLQDLCGSEKGGLADLSSMRDRLVDHRFAQLDFDLALGVLRFSGGDKLRDGGANWFSDFIGCDFQEFPDVPYARWLTALCR